ncbi:hypothetical protein, partial [Burkholderia pseudomallei]|uniref:hypothetical protein n=1 Tax=Burkholderia pseudomallei TaxID=28450 RepID=UPI002115EE5E
FFMTSFSPLEAILSSFNWSENSRAGQHGAANLPIDGLAGSDAADWLSASRTSHAVGGHSAERTRVDRYVPRLGWA